MKRLLAVLAVLALVFAACGGDDSGGSDAAGTSTESAGDAIHGEELYGQSCTACHGPDATGIEGLGKNLRNNEFVQGLSDDELVDFLTVGRGADDSANTTGVAMPPKGGNPALTDQDLLDLAAYLRTLQ